MRTFLLSLCALTACGLDEDRFDDLFAERFCGRFKACDEDAFWDQWQAGTPACHEDVADQIDDKRYGNGTTSACSYDERAAMTCLDALAAATCEQVTVPGYPDRCADAWDCVTVIDPGAP